MNIWDYKIYKIYTRLNKETEYTNVKPGTSFNPLFITETDTSEDDNASERHIYKSYPLDTKFMGKIASKQFEFLVKHPNDTIEILYEFRLEYNGLIILIIKSFLKLCMEDEVESITDRYISARDRGVYKDTGRSGVIFDIIEKIYNRLCALKQTNPHYQQGINYYWDDINEVFEKVKGIKKYMNPNFGNTVASQAFKYFKETYKNGNNPSYIIEEAFNHTVIRLTSSGTPPDEEQMDYLRTNCLPKINKKVEAYFEELKKIKKPIHTEFTPSPQKVLIHSPVSDFEGKYHNDIVKNLEIIEKIKTHNPINIAAVISYFAIKNNYFKEYEFLIRRCVKINPDFLFTFMKNEMFKLFKDGQIKILNVYLQEFLKKLDSYK